MRSPTPFRWHCHSISFFLTWPYRCIHESYHALAHHPLDVPSSLTHPHTPFVHTRCLRHNYSHKGWNKKAPTAQPSKKEREIHTSTEGEVRINWLIFAFIFVSDLIVLPCVAVCCSVLQCAVVCCSVGQFVERCSGNGCSLVWGGYVY